ncbi:YfhO family protein [Liquorilactobacillus vini]|uniref:YfhO family protein n=1 Tax=Liquorilactobacillus vini TaxID=238015 RepID=UPI0002ED1812|nr:YfhO family protein [Liquorilactobacillus vini]
MNLKKYKYFFLISFLLPMVMMLYWYYLAGIFPFGNKSVIVGDLSNQYLAILAYFKNNFFHPSNLLYSFKFGLGGNFFPVITYYLVSPLNLLALFFPTKDLIGFFTLNLVFNSGWAGMMMFYFLIKSHWLNRGTTQLKPKFMSLILALSTAYALSSFYIAYAHCFMWFNAIAVLPLVVLGLDRLYFKDKANLYWISYVYLLLVNYYIGYMTTIFLALLTIFFAISSMMFKDREPKKIIISLLKILMYTVLSLLSSLIVFLPSWLAQKAVTQEKMKYQYLPLFKSFDGLANLFPKVSVNNAPFLYTSLLVLLLAITFFFSKKISEKERNLTGTFALLIFISVWLSAFYQIWHVFTMPNGYPSRESFVLIFSIVCLAYRALCVQLEERSF